MQPTQCKGEVKRHVPCTRQAKPFSDYCPRCFGKHSGIPAVQKAAQHLSDLFAEMAWHEPYQAYGDEFGVPSDEVTLLWWKFQALTDLLDKGDNTYAMKQVRKYEDKLRRGKL